VTPVVRALLILNVVAYFLQQTLAGFTGAFLFVPSVPYLVTHPWTLVTYMFLHASLTHILFNMLGLYFFGPRVEERLGSRQFGAMYVVAGVTGALLSLVLGGGAPILGASGGVYGVMLGFAYFWPDTPISIWGVIPVPARLLVIIYTVISLLGGFGGGGNVAHFAHLGGFVGAYLYLKWIERDRARFRRQATAPPRDAVRSADAYRTIDRSKLHELNRSEVDRILDKISAQGVGSLTPQERLFLSNFVPPDDRKPPVQ
jgi:membrane associated rhomboid family serine protease